MSSKECTHIPPSCIEWKSRIAVGHIYRDIPTSLHPPHPCLVEARCVTWSHTDLATCQHIATHFDASTTARKNKGNLQKQPPTLRNHAVWSFLATGPNFVIFVFNFISFVTDRIVLYAEFTKANTKMTKWFAAKAKDYDSTTQPVLLSSLSILNIQPPSSR